jgi:hypothetical protein
MTQLISVLDHFHPFRGRFGGDDVPSPCEPLRQTGPGAVAHPGCTRGEIALLDAPMTAVHRAGSLLSLAPRRQRTAPCAIGAELRLMVLNDHDRSASLVHHRLRHGAWGQERVHRDHAACQD